MPFGLSTLEVSAFQRGAIQDGVLLGSLRLFFYQSGKASQGFRGSGFRFLTFRGLFLFDSYFVSVTFLSILANTFVRTA